MNMKDVLKDIENQNSYRVEQRLNEMIRKNPSYRHLNKDNQELVLDLLKKYKTKVRKGIRVSGLTIRRDMYRLHRNRLKFDLTKRDLNSIRKILRSFKS